MISSISLWVIALISILCCVDSFSFSDENKCGCVREYTCTDCAPCEEYKPFCQPTDMEFKDFVPSYLDNCNDWMRGYNIQVTNNSTGTVNITMLLPFKFRGGDRYEISLLIKDRANQVENNASLPLNHSIKYFKVARTNITCKRAVSFEFAFLFNGTYELSIAKRSKLNQETSVSSSCKSKPFSISSLYEKKLLNELEPTFYHRYAPQRQELVFMSQFDNFSTGLHPYATVVTLKSKVDMSLSDCSGSGNEVANYILHDSKTGSKCCAYERNNTEVSYCPCEWQQGNQELKCIFTNVSSGDYCFVVGFYDPRCKPWTIWTKGSVTYCSWSYNASLQGNATSIVVGIPGKDSILSVLLLSILIGLTCIIGLILLYIYWPKCMKKLRHGLNNYTANSIMSQSSESSTVSWLIKDHYEKSNMPEVLLLYPKDCSAFMDAMEEFRTVMRNSNCKVHDPWDDEIYSTVVQSCESWSLSFITNENVKIVIVLSDCSKKFEKAFLENYTLGYKEPETLDVVFSQSLAAIHQYFSNRYDSYRRIFVVQLDDGSPSMNFEFITPATVYSIPQSTMFLMRDMLSENYTELPSYKLKKLKDATANLKTFKKAQPEYLHQILDKKGTKE